MRGKYVCGRCNSSVKGGGASLVYEGVVRKMIKEIKYRQSRDMIGELIGMWTTHTSTINPCCDQVSRSVVVTSVPMWEGKKRKRGFNQAELMAREFSRRWRVEYRELLVRKRETKPMYGLKPDKKVKNVSEAFSLCEGVLIQDKDVILVDDVVTSGATTQECRRVLLASGVKSVRVVAVAR